jgi:rfaE bifunctional protein kinase chain/domain
MNAPTPTAGPMIDRVGEALRVIVGRRVMVVGDPMLDAYLYGETVRVSREAPVLVVRKERMDYRLGGAANTAANLAALGVETSLAGVVGCDQAATQLRDMLEEKGVQTAGLVASGGTTPIKTRILAGAFGTARQQVLRIDEEPGPFLAPASRQIAADLRSLGRKCDAIVISDYGQGSIGEDVIDCGLELARQGHIVCADSRQRLDRFVGITAITPNIPEAEALTGLDLSIAGSLDRAGRQLLQRLGCGLCLIKQGRSGMTLFGKDGDSSHVAIVGEEEVTDVTGAGDTVIAVFAAALAAGLGGENAMRLANCAAGVVVTKVGTASASPDEIFSAARRAGMELVPWVA